MRLLLLLALLFTGCVVALAKPAPDPSDKIIRRVLEVEECVIQRKTLTMPAPSGRVEVGEIEMDPEDAVFTCPPGQVFLSMDDGCVTPIDNLEQSP